MLTRAALGIEGVCQDLSVAALGTNGENKTPVRAKPNQERYQADLLSGGTPLPGRGSTMRVSLEKIVSSILKEMGVAAPDNMIRTLALREGCLVAEKFRYDGGYAVWLVGSEAVNFYDDDGRLLKKAHINPPKDQIAA
jgi:hypothetical protein